MTGWKRGRSTSTYVECAGVGDGRLAKHARDAIDVDVDVREAGTSTVGGGVWHASVRGGRTTTTTTSPTSSASTMTTTTTMTTTEPTPGGGWTDDAMDVDGSTASSPARRVLAHRREFGFSGGVARALAFGSPSRGAFPLDPSA